MNQHLFPAPQMPADGVSTNARAIERAAHVASALGLRLTSHEWLRLARQYPLNAQRYRAEAMSLRDYARWNLNKARDLDAMAEWMRERKGA